MKLENETRYIAEYAGLASKMYSLFMIAAAGDHKTILKGKGVPSRVLKDQASHALYKSMLVEPRQCEAAFRALRSKNHSIEQLELVKRMLTALNEKVFQLSAFFSRPLGHWRNAQPSGGASSSSGSAV